MLLINYPEPEFKIKRDNGKELIFDPLRKKWLRLTPEEWVRQNFIQFLIKVKGYPAGLIAMEKRISLGELVKRFDILIFDNDHNPWMMVECKAPSVKLDENVLHQLLRYHLSVPVKVLVITNGEETHAWAKKDNRISILELIPSFPS